MSFEPTLEHEAPQSRGTMRVIVLNDGETFTSLDGCRIIEVPDDWITEDIEDALLDGSEQGRTICTFTDELADAFEDWLAEHAGGMCGDFGKPHTVKCGIEGSR